VGKTRYARAAATDLGGIGIYTRKTWGKTQELKYLDMLESSCERLAETPLLGRKCDEISPGLRRMEVGQHIIFYREGDSGIVVVRVLHRAMLPSRWSMES
jgi:toxin ParE1/3/4